jgi:hypothetical protein
MRRRFSFFAVLTSALALTATAGWAEEEKQPAAVAAPAAEAPRATAETPPRSSPAPAAAPDAPRKVEKADSPEKPAAAVVPARAPVAAEAADASPEQQPSVVPTRARAPSEQSKPEASPAPAPAPAPAARRPSAPAPEPAPAPVAIPAAAPSRPAAPPSAPAPAPARSPERDPNDQAPTPSAPAMAEDPLEALAPHAPRKPEQVVEYVARLFFTAMMAGDARTITELTSAPFFLEERRFTEEQELLQEWLRALRQKRTDLLVLYGVEVLTPAAMEAKYGKPPARLAHLPWRGPGTYLAVANLSGRAAVRVVKEVRDRDFRVVAYHD